MPYYKACYYEDEDEDVRTEVGSLPPSELQLHEVDTAQICSSTPQLELFHVLFQKNHFDTLKLIYSIGYGASLTALLVAILLFCCFRLRNLKDRRGNQSFCFFSLSPFLKCSPRKLLCTRNYIHLNLFVTFVLRSVAVFVKDSVLFADKSLDHCTTSTVRLRGTNLSVLSV